MKFMDNNGNAISPEEMSEWEKEFDAGDFSNWDTSAPVRYGKYAPHQAEEKVGVSVTLPISMKEKLTEFTKQNNCTTSDFVRVAIAKQLQEVS